MKDVGQRYILPSYLEFPETTICKEWRVIISSIFDLCIDPASITASFKRGEQTGLSMFKSYRLLRLFRPECKKSLHRSFQVPVRYAIKAHSDRSRRLSGAVNAPTTGTVTKKKDDSNVLLDNIGTIFLSCIGLVIGALVRSHYGTKNKTSIRDYIEEMSAIDPLELYELQASNADITISVYREICMDVIDSIGKKFIEQGRSPTELSMTYKEFVTCVRSTMKRQRGEEFTIQLGHLLDRVVVSALERRNKNLESEMHVIFWLTVLSITVNCSVKDRIKALFEIMQIYHFENQKSVEHDSESATDNTFSSMKLTIDEVQQLVGYLQDTCQLVPDAQIVPTLTKYPVQQYTVGAPDQLVTWEDNGASESEKGSMTQDMTTKIIGEQRCIDLDAFSAILCSKSVCAWGECYHKHKAYQ